MASSDEAFSVTTKALPITTEDGCKLEAEIASPANPQAVAVLSHPHPLYGGDMHNPLISSLFQALPAASITAVRYNFRGVGSSEGKHDESADPLLEARDAYAAFSAAAALAPAPTNPEPANPESVSPESASPVLVSVGWSFGADVSLSVDHPALAAWVGIAAPLRIVDPAKMPTATHQRSKLLLVPERDDFCPPETAEQRSANWPACTLEVVKGADHFLFGNEAQVAERVVAFIGTLAS